MTMMILPIIPRKTLNKALLASLNTLCTSRQRPGPDMYPLACGGVNYRPPPFAAFCIDDLNLKNICKLRGEFYGAAYLRTTSTGLAVWSLVVVPQMKLVYTAWMMGLPLESERGWRPV